MAEDSIPTAEEYALFREAYAETYPVRPLLNAIDAKDAEIKRLRAALEYIANINTVGSPYGVDGAKGAMGHQKNIAAFARRALADQGKEAQRP